MSVEIVLLPVLTELEARSREQPHELADGGHDYAGTSAYRTSIASLSGSGAASPCVCRYPR